MGLKHRILCMLSKHGTDWASSLVSLIFHKGSYYIAPAGLELATHLSLRQTHNFPAFVSQILGLWACATMPSLVRWFVYTCLCLGVMHAAACEWSETNFRCRSSPCTCSGQDLLPCSLLYMPRLLPERFQWFSCFRSLCLRRDSLRLWMHTLLCLAFYVGSGDPKSGCQTCGTITLPTEPSPQSLYFNKYDLI